jgi:hypothetical protein
MSTMFPDDPTHEEVAGEIRRAREVAEREAERKRREEWDREHGSLSDPAPGQEQEFGTGLGEIEAVSEEDVEIDG